MEFSTFGSESPLPLEEEEEEEKEKYKQIFSETIPFLEHFLKKSVFSPLKIPKNYKLAFGEAK